MGTARGTGTAEVTETTRVPGTANAPGAPGTPGWVTLVAPRPERLKGFYETLLGWEFRPGPPSLGMNLRAFVGDRPVAAIGQAPQHRASRAAAWTPFLLSADIDLAAMAVGACGGTIGVGPLNDREGGRLAIGADPSGAVFGIRSVAPFGRPGEGPGTPAWHELLTYEPYRIAPFYQRVFGLSSVRETNPEGAERVVLHAGGRPIASIRGLGRGETFDRGPHWVTWFQVRDVDADALRAVDLGGRIAEAPHDGPYGRTATVVDPEGTPLGLLDRRR